MSFEIGQKVVCVDATFEEWVKVLYTALPKKDAVYVVRDVQLGVTPSKGKFEGAVCLLLVGLVNPRAESRAARERGFNAERFRSLEEMRARIVAVEDLEECVLVTVNTPGGVAGNIQHSS